MDLRSSMLPEFCRETLGSFLQKNVENDHFARNFSLALAPSKYM